MRFYIISMWVKFTKLRHQQKYWNKKNTILTSNLSPVTRECVHLVDRNFTLREYAFSTLSPWPWPDDLYILTWPIFTELPGDHMCENELMNFLHQCFQKLSSDSHTYIRRDRQTRPKLYTTPLRGWSKIDNQVSADFWIILASTGLQMCLGKKF